MVEVMRCAQDDMVEAMAGPFLCLASSGHNFNGWAASNWVGTTAFSSSETGKPAPEAAMPSAIFPSTPCQAPFCLLEIPEPAFVCCLYTGYTYMFVFQKLFCSPFIRQTV